jgi:hypothetical protein
MIKNVVSPQIFCFIQPWHAIERVGLCIKAGARFRGRQGEGKISMGHKALGCADVHGMGCLKGSDAYRLFMDFS